MHIMHTQLIHSPYICIYIYNLHVYTRQCIYAYQVTPCTHALKSIQAIWVGYHTIVCAYKYATYTPVYISVIYSLYICLYTTYKYLYISTCMHKCVIIYGMQCVPDLFWRVKISECRLTYQHVVLVSSARLRCADVDELPRQHVLQLNNTEI